MNTHHEKLTRKGSKHAKPELRAQQIIEAAIKCFGENGYVNTTIDTIAKLAGLSKGTVYRFFASKDDLLLSIIDHIQDIFNARYEEEAVDKTSLEKLELYIHISIEEIVNEQELVPIWFQILHLSFAQRKLQSIFQDDINRISAIIKEGINKGEFKPSALHSVPKTLIALLNGHFLLSHFFKDNPDDWLKNFDCSWQLIKNQLSRK